MSRFLFSLLALALISSLSFAVCSARITVRDNSWSTLPAFNNVSMACDGTCTSCTIDGVSGSSDLYAKIDYTELDTAPFPDFWHQMGALKLRNKSFLTYYKLSLYDTNLNAPVNGANITIYRNGTSDIVWQSQSFDYDPSVSWYCCAGATYAYDYCDSDSDEGGFDGGNSYFILDSRDSYDINIKHPTYSKVKVALVGYDADAYSSAAADRDTYGTGNSDTRGATNFWFLDNDLSKPGGVTFNLNSMGVDAYGPQDLIPLQPSEMWVNITDPYLVRGTVCSGNTDNDGDLYCSLLSHKFAFNDKKVLNYDAAFSAPKYATLNPGNVTPFTGFTVPNFFRFGSNVSSTKPFKMVQKTELDLSNNTYIWLMFPPKASEYNFSFNDFINPSFTFASTVSIARKSGYIPNSCVITGVGSSWSADTSVPVCTAMLSAGSQAGDWFLVSYQVKAPGTPAYYTFPSNGNISSMLPP